MRKLAILIVLFLSCAVWAQEKTGQLRGVTTTGTAEISVVPDEVLLQVGVEHQSPRARTAKAAADATSRKILTALKDLGIDSKDVQTAYLSLQPQFDYKKGMQISYFSAEQSLTVKLHDASKIDDVLDVLIKAGGNRVDGIEYQSSELRKYRDQAREEAVKAAREKAEALAKALGQQIGKAYSIEEEKPQYFQFGAVSNVEMYDDKTRAKPAGPSTSAGQMKVSTSVTVTFDLI
jgi:uncharacterized protein